MANVSLNGDCRIDPRGPGLFLYPHGYSVWSNGKKLAIPGEWIELKPTGLSSKATYFERFTPEEKEILEQVSWSFNVSENGGDTGSLMVLIATFGKEVRWDEAEWTLTVIQGESAMVVVLPEFTWPPKSETVRHSPRFDREDVL